MCLSLLFGGWGLSFCEQHLWLYKLQAVCPGGKKTYICHEQITNQINKDASNAVSSASMLTCYFHACCKYVQYLQETPCSGRGQLAESGIWQTEADKVPLAIVARLTRRGCFPSSSLNAGNLTKRGSFVVEEGLQLRLFMDRTFPSHILRSHSKWHWTAQTFSELKSLDSSWVTGVVSSAEVVPCFVKWRGWEKKGCWL